MSRGDSALDPVVLGVLLERLVDQLNELDRLACAGGELDHRELKERSGAAMALAVGLLELYGGAGASSAG